MTIKWIATSEERPWVTQEVGPMESVHDTLEITNQKGQIIDGFGGCFNELGYIALKKLPEAFQEELLDALFDQEKGCGFNFCRTPMGASDYARSWYSYDEVESDYALKHFSVERDQQDLIPYIQRAKLRQPEMKLFASPWSPPTWMKTSQAYNYGRLRMETSVLEAYSQYFLKFISAYEALGIPIHQIHIQNEPFADQKFPSCLWSAEQFVTFIRDYLGPLLKKTAVNTEIWLGTLNGPTQMNFKLDGSIDIDLYDEYVDRILFDEETRKYLTGVGYQWAGQHVIARTHESFPELKLMQTENECGDGTNTWAYARYVFNLIRHYLVNGVNSYTYWNMILEPGGLSTWGWHQNTLITVDPEKGNLIYNPEFYVMKHFAHFIKAGAVRLETKGHWTGASVVFENPNGEIIILISNALGKKRKASIRYGEYDFTIEMNPYTFNTMVLCE